MIYLACTFIQMIFIDMFFVFFQSGVPRHSAGDLLRFEYITSLFSCLCISMLTSNSSGNMQKHGYLGCFHAAFARENVSWVWVIYSVYNKNYSDVVWVLMDLTSQGNLLCVWQELQRCRMSVDGSNITSQFTLCITRITAMLYECWWI